MAKILVIEDEAAIRELYRIHLQAAGYEVAVAEDAETALRMVSEWKPDLLVVDVQLRGENGLDVLREALAVRPELRSIVATAYGGYRDDFTAWLADAFLTKSTDTSELVHKVGEVLDRNWVG
jgi:DNA-binding response OmpR family regulator